MLRFLSYPGPWFAAAGAAALAVPYLALALLPLWLIGGDPTGVSGPETPSADR